VTAGLTCLAIVIPTTAWAVGTAATPHTGSIPTAVSGGTGGFGGGGFGGGTPGGAGGGRGFGGGTAEGGFGGAGQTGTGPGGTGAGSGGTGTSTVPGGTGTVPGGSGAVPGGQGDGTRPSGGEMPQGTGTTRERGSAQGGLRGARGTGTGSFGTGAGGFGGGGIGGATSAKLIAALEKTTTRWAAAVEGSQSAASLELATGGKAVMAMGGFTGSDPAPTLAEFEAWAKAGDITYYIAGGQGGGPGGGGSASQITAWVEAHYKSTTIGGETVYVLYNG
jgi:hypothetical protein